jgi:hypothetical protein
VTADVALYQLILTDEALVDFSSCTTCNRRCAPAPTVTGCVQP